MGRASRKRRERAELRASGLLPNDEKPVDRGGRVRAPVPDMPNRKAFLVYSLAMLGLWVAGLTVFPTALPQQISAMVLAWAVCTAGAIVFRVRRDGADWVMPFVRRGAPLAAGLAAFGAALWFVAPSFGGSTATYVQQLAPGFLVALLMVGTGRMIFPIQPYRASR